MRLLNSIGREQEHCRSLVKGFIERIERLVKRDLKEGRPLLRVEDVVNEAVKYAAEYGGCNYTFESYDGLYDDVVKLALDSAMEALSQHVESLENDLYNILAMILTHYATHIARLVASVKEIAKTSYPLTRFIYEAVEPLLFASLARLVALSSVVRKAESKDVALILPRLQVLVEGYIDEENSILHGFIRTISL
jgi:hypothetical protein